MNDDILTVRDLSKAASELSKMLAQIDFEAGQSHWNAHLARCKMLASAIADHIGEHAAACKEAK